MRSSNSAAAGAPRTLPGAGRAPRPAAGAAPAILAIALVLAAGRDAGVALAARFLVAPVRGDAVLGVLVHLLGADLDLDGRPSSSAHDGVQRLVAVRLGPRDVVVELLGIGARCCAPGQHRVAVFTSATITRNARTSNSSEKSSSLPRIFFQML